MIVQHLPIRVVPPVDHDGQASGRAVEPAVEIIYRGRTDPAGLPSAVNTDWVAVPLAVPEGNATVAMFARQTPAGTEHLLRFGERDHAEFVIDPTLSRAGAWWSWPDAPSAPERFPAELANLLFGPVLGVILRLRDLPVIHASTVAVEGTALLIAGHSGAGKSTLLTAMNARGHHVLTDDMTIPFLEDAVWKVCGGIAQTRLHPASLAHFGLHAGDLAQVFTGMEKRTVRLETCADAARPRPVAAIILLAPRGGHAGPVADRMAPASGLAALWQHVYPAFLPIDAGQRRVLFAAFASMAATVPIHVLQQPDDLERVDEAAALLARIAGQ